MGKGKGGGNQQAAKTQMASATKLEDCQDTGKAANVVTVCIWTAIATIGAVLSYSFTKKGLDKGSEAAHKKAGLENPYIRAGGKPAVGGGKEMNDFEAINDVVERAKNNPKALASLKGQVSKLN